MPVDNCTTLQAAIKAAPANPTLAFKIKICFIKIPNFEQDQKPLFYNNAQILNLSDKYSALILIGKQ